MNETFEGGTEGVRANEQRVAEELRRSETNKATDAVQQVVSGIATAKLQETIDRGESIHIPALDITIAPAAAAQNRASWATAFGREDEEMRRLQHDARTEEVDDGGPLVTVWLLVAISLLGGLLWALGWVPW